MDSSKKYRNPSPEATANIFSRLFYCWTLVLFKYGYRNDLQITDIYNTTKDDISGTLGDELERNWEEEVTRAKNETTPNLQRAIFKTLYKPYLLYGFGYFLKCIGMSTVHPLILAEYINFFNSPEDEKESTGWIFGIAFVLFTFLSIILSHYINLGCRRIGMRVRIACSSLIYRKLLRLNQVSLSQTDTGHLVNLLSNDVQRFDTAFHLLHFIWITPVVATFALVVMYKNIGVSAIVGMSAISIQAVPIQGYMSKLIGDFRFKIAQRTDYRVKLLNEIISGILLIKMYAWEKPFEKMMRLSRKLEIDVIAKSSYIRCVLLSMMLFTDRVALYITLTCYVLLGNRLTGSVVFSMAQIFYTIQLVMVIQFPTALAAYSEAIVSVNRIKAFLLLDEKAEKSITIGESVKPLNTGKIEIVDVNASWLPNANVDSLIDLNLIVKPGTICFVIGSVGAGKTSLLHLLLKELPSRSGNVYLNGRISYASQEPWLFHSSVKDNILFGKPYNENRYNDVVRVCALQHDFEQMPFGDQTLVGEKGVSLSGGQRARINLARAVYTVADIYIFDDPLSAVDVQVGKHLFEECIKNFLKDKTRILVTHQLHFMKQTDLIVFMNDGKIENISRFDELNENQLSLLQQEPSHEEEKDISSNRELDQIQPVENHVINEEEPEETDELIEKGVIATSTYLDYARAGASTFTLLVILFLFIMSQVVCNASDLWLTHWTNAEEMKLNKLGFNKNSSLNLTNANSSKVDIIEYPILPHSNYAVKSEESFILVYTILILTSVLLTICRSFVFFKVCMVASRVLHNKMFSHILQAPMQFFDTNLSGRILNRFSKDMGIIDEFLPQGILDGIQIFCAVFGVFVMTFLISPWMIIPSIALAVILNFIRITYLASAQDIKRLEGVAKAPIFSHISATLNGITTIRAANAEKMVIQEFDALQDQHTGTWFISLACSECFGFYLDITSGVFFALLTLQFLVLRDENTLSGNVGLVVSQSVLVITILEFGIRLMSEVANNMVSVERVLQYTKIEKEGPFKSLSTKTPPRNWPHSGAITFKNTYLRYAPNQMPVLKNLNVEIKPGEKIGIVGRTGAGKSTFIASLFRLAPIEGTVTIDDIDTTSIGLQDLRSNISVIPQKPVLFSASLRINLDPFANYSDEILWKALENVELKNAVDDLNQQVNEGGSNFSAGQRQLICLARAIVQDNMILVMDEATANVDHNTDLLIQKTIRENFKNRTVITVAHRLNTVMDSDRVLVMDAGEAVEFDNPHELLQNPNGYFTKMVKNTGSNMEATLRKVASDSYELLHAKSEDLETNKN